MCFAVFVLPLPMSSETRFSRAKDFLGVAPAIPMGGSDRVDARAVYESCLNFGASCSNLGASFTTSSFDLGIIQFLISRDT